MHYWEYIFFISCFIVFYNYAGYAIIAFTLNRIKRKFKKSPEITTTSFPGVSFIVAAFNEEDFIEQKILNSLGQDYPPEKIEFIFVTDGSTDKTAEIIRQYPAIRLLHEEQRNGKSAAMNRAAQIASRDIIIFSDANTTLNAAATKNIARHYQDKRTGGVAGEKKVIPPPGSAHEVGAGEGLYWKYESFLKKVDSEFYSVVGAAGELFSIRRELFEPLPPNVILDDFVISLKLTKKGYRVRYEPTAYAMETPSFSLTDEHLRKVRIAAGGFQAMGMLRSLLLPWPYPSLTFLYVSHRVLRWTLSPLCFILALLSNMVLSYHPGGIFRPLLAAQLLFYGLAIAGQFAGPRLSRLKLLKLPSYFVFMNISVIQGFFRFLKGRQTVNWEKARRTMPSTHQP